MSTSARTTFKMSFNRNKYIFSWFLFCGLFLINSLAIDNDIIRESMALANGIYVLIDGICASSDGRHGLSPISVI